MKCQFAMDSIAAIYASDGGRAARKRRHQVWASAIDPGSATKFELVINVKTAKALGLQMADKAARTRRRGDRAKRREFITMLGGAAAASKPDRAINASFIALPAATSRGVALCGAAPSQTSGYLRRPAWTP